MRESALPAGCLFFAALKASLQWGGAVHGNGKWSAGECIAGVPEGLFCSVQGTPSVHGAGTFSRAYCHPLLEVVGVFAPWLLLLDQLLLRCLITIKRVHLLPALRHVVLQLPSRTRCAGIHCKCVHSLQAQTQLHRSNAAKKRSIWPNPNHLANCPAHNYQLPVPQCTHTPACTGHLHGKGSMDGDGEPSQPAAAPLMAPGPVCTFGWSYDPSRTQDSNFLDLALAVSRNSRCDGGHMGWVLSAGPVYPAVGAHQRACMQAHAPRVCRPWEGRALL